MVAEALVSAFVGVLAFVATNLDGLFLVMVTLASGKISRGEAVWGQVIGTAVLMGLSLAGAIGTILVPNEWHHLLGAIPLAIGIKQLVDSWRVRRPAVKLSSGLAPDAPAVPVVEPGKLLHNARLDTLGRSGTLLVALLTVSHGGDNIGVYVALFSAQSFFLDGVQILVALGMAVLWGRLCAALIAHPRLGAPFRRAGPWLLPWVLIGLGVLILAGADLF
jgi:cadmium resistance protein CadD (predicted permease)